MLNQTSTVSDKYQVVVPAKVREVLKIKKGQKIVWSVLRDTPLPEVLVSPANVDWAKSLAGIAKGTWADVDPQKYIDELRNEWER